MSTKKYVSLSKLSDFLNNLKNLFATKEDIANKANVEHLHEIENINGLQGEIDNTQVKFDEIQASIDALANIHPDWNENNLDSPYYIENRPFYTEMVNSIGENILPSTVATSINDNSLVFELDSEIELDTYNQYHVQIKASDSDITYIFLEEFLDSLNPSWFTGDGISLNISGTTITVTLDQNMYLLSDAMSYSITINYAESYEHVQTIDPKYLPTESKPDWNENNPEYPSYINGRTHYIETVSAKVSEISELVFSEYQTRENGEVIYSASGTNESLVFEVGQYYVVQYPYGWCGVIAEEYNGMIVVGDKYLYNETKFSSGEGFFITTDGTGAYTIYDNVGETIADLMIESETSNVVQLDEIFIPDSIARTTDYYNIEEIDQLINEKANVEHSHTIANITGLQDELNALNEITESIPDNEIDAICGTSIALLSEVEF